MNIVPKYKQINILNHKKWDDQHDDPSGGWGIKRVRKRLTIELMKTPIPETGAIVMLGTGVKHNLFDIWCDIWGDRVIGVNKKTKWGLVPHKNIYVGCVSEFTKLYDNIKISVCFNDISSTLYYRRCGYEWARNRMEPGGLYIDSEMPPNIHHETGHWKNGNFKPVSEITELNIYRSNEMNEHPFFSC